MAKKPSRPMSEHKRAERRRRDRERARQATEALLTSDGWQRWVRARAVFDSYSLQNTLLLAYQCAARGITPTRVGGFRAWLKLGRCVRKGEAALWVMAPMPIKPRDPNPEEPGEQRLLFRSVPVFELSQTDMLPGVEPGPLEPPSVAIDGDSHAHPLEPLTALADEIGYTASFAQLDGAPRRVLRLQREAHRHPGAAGTERQGPRRCPRARLRPRRIQRALRPRPRRGDRRVRRLHRLLRTRPAHRWRVGALPRGLGRERRPRCDHRCRRS